ncbi:MAG: hypothetical protein Q9225_005049 [Loekoesia sp. 1 TL-2023]
MLKALFSPEGYRYEKLAGVRLFRLIDLQPSSTFSDQLVCNLRHVCLNIDTYFEALSYTWGDGRPTCELQCNGHRLYIRPSLETALKFLRREQEHRTLWVDAICINQDDVHEREQQVSRMGDIFSHASQVIAWIGEKSLADAPALNIEKLQYEVIDPVGEFAIWKLENYITALLRAIMAAMTLLHRPWFSRTWIIQEVALSRKLFLQCSDIIINWNSLLALLRLLPLVTDTEGTRIYFGEKLLERAQFVAFMRNKIADQNMNKMRRQNSEDSQMPYSLTLWQELQHVVSQARPFEATNKSDHIFALLGILDQKITKVVHVDYETSYHKIYREFTRVLIITTGTLIVLGHVDLEPDGQRESWVPDWSSTPSVDPLSSDKDPYYSATSGTDVQVQNSEASEVLALSGIMIDRIDHIRPGPTSDAMEALNRYERFIAKGTQLGLAESTPLLPYKSIRRMIPSVRKPGGQENDVQPRKHTIPRKPVSSAASSVDDDSMDYFASSSSSRSSTNSSQVTAGSCDSSPTSKEATSSIANLLARGIFTGLTRDPCVRQNHYIWGSIHPVNSVYMKTSLELSWKDTLSKAKQSPYGKGIEEAYWRTLIGDKRTNVTLDVSEPPYFWQHAFRLWRRMLWDKQGHVSRFAKELGSKIMSPLQEDAPSTSREPNPIQNQQLRDYIQAENAQRERVNRNEQLQVPAFRNFLSTLIKIYNKVRPEDEVAPGYSNNELTADLDNLPNLSNQAAARLKQSFSILPTTRLSDDELRNEIDKAFWYDFLRVARNRQFCVTKNGYIGWIPLSARVGDRICLFLGGQVPYVIRPHKKKKGDWQFLGEAYIHGIMKGEAFKKYQHRTETIRLR